MHAGHHRGGKLPGQSTLARMLALNNHLAVMLGRPPTVKDLSTTNLAALEHHLRRVVRRRKSTAVLYCDAFRSALRFAADLGLVTIDPAVRRKAYTWNPDHDGKAVKLSGEEGSLWAICLSLYFPRNLRIR